MGERTFLPFPVISLDMPCYFLLTVKTNQNDTQTKWQVPGSHADEMTNSKMPIFPTKPLWQFFALVLAHPSCQGLEVMSGCHQLFPSKLLILWVTCEWSHEPEFDASLLIAILTGPPKQNRTWIDNWIVRLVAHRIGPIRPSRKRQKLLKEHCWIQFLVRPVDDRRKYLTDILVCIIQK